MNLVGDESTCVVDSGASSHLTPDRKCFSSYKDEDYGFVKMGNEGACRIVSIGDVFANLNWVQTHVTMCATNYSYNQTSFKNGVFWQVTKVRISTFIVHDWHNFWSSFNHI